MEDFSNSTSLTKEQQEKDVKTVDDDIEAGIGGTTGRATEPESEKEAAKTADEEISRKRAGKISTADIEHDPKKKKVEQLENQDLDKADPSKAEGGEASKKEQKQTSKKKKMELKTQDVAIPTPFNGGGKASEKKEVQEPEQEQHAFNVPKTPPGTSKAPVPATPMGKPPQEMNPKYTPSRPKGTSRLLKW